MEPTKEQKAWIVLCEREESIAFQKLVSFARNHNKDDGYTTAKHVVDYILRLKSQIANKIGNCPEYPE